jgi:hypothetical protein
MERPRIGPGRAGAAVALLLVLLGAVWLLLRAPRLMTTPPAIRPITGTRLQPDQPLILAWEGGGPPYDVTLISAEEKPIWSGKTLQTALVRIPPEIRARLRSGDYRWRVEGRDAAGRPFASNWFELRVEEPAQPARPV